MGKKIVDNTILDKNIPNFLSLLIKLYIIKYYMI